MSENDWMGDRVNLIAHRYICVTDTRGNDAHENFVVARVGEFQVFKRLRRLYGPGDGCSDLHGIGDRRIPQW